MAIIVAAQTSIWGLRYRRPRTIDFSQCGAPGLSTSLVAGRRSGDDHEDSTAQARARQGRGRGRRNERGPASDDHPALRAGPLPAQLARGAEDLPRVPCPHVRPAAARAPGEPPPPASTSRQVVEFPPPPRLT